MNRLLFFIACLASSTFAMAEGQRIMTVSTSDEQQKVFLVSDVEEITFGTLGAYEKVFNGHAYVDLGLENGTLWATCNVGAASPESYGGYFAWGETKTKESYNWKNDGDYAHGTFDSKTSPDYGMTKYNTADGEIELKEADDAATANWGKGWRTPTEEEWVALFDFIKDEEKSTCEWTTYNGVAGYLITSKVNNGAKLFLPAAGCKSTYGLDDIEQQGIFWSSTRKSTNPHSAAIAYFYDPDVYATYGIIDKIDYNDRCYGLSVRAVCDIPAEE